MICGLAHLLTAAIPQHAIYLSFALAFVRSITLAWPTFLLDLCLLDEVDNAIISLSPSPTRGSSFPSPSPTTLSYTEIAAGFQSQAATYRSIGCVVANVFALVIYALPNVLSTPQSENHSKISDILNHRIFQFVLLCTGMLNFSCAIIQWRYSGKSPKQHPHQTNSSPSDNNERSINQLMLPNNAEFDTDIVAAIKPSMILPSYDSIEGDLMLPLNDSLLRKAGGSLELDTCIVDTEQLLLRDSKDTFKQNDPESIHNNQSNTHTSDNYFAEISRTGLIVLLQLLAVLLTLRQSLVRDLITKVAWTCLTSILSGLFFYCVYYQTSIVRTHSDAVLAQQHERQLRAGLYLILRYSIPSVSYLMSSYVYTIYKDVPSALQILSLLDMCVTTIACYTYSKYLSKYSSGKQLLRLIVTTTVLSGISLFGNVLLIRLLNPKSSTIHEQNDGNNFSMTTKIIFTAIINAIIGFFNEWKFFPDVVLATAVSADCSSGTTLDSSSTTVSTNEVSLADPTIHHTASDDPLQPTNSKCTIRLNRHEEDNTSHNATCGGNSSSTLSSPKMRNVQYGTLLSCIDFGDQIGILLAGPLIAIFHTTRNNGDDHWQHLEVLQIINSILILLSAFLIFIVPNRR
jgi:hypothetical protein